MSDIQWVPISGCSFNLSDHSYGYECTHHRDRFRVIVDNSGLLGRGRIIYTSKNDKIILQSKGLHQWTEDTEKDIKHITSWHMKYVQEKYIYPSEGGSFYNIKHNDGSLFEISETPSFEVKWDRAMKEYVLYADGKVFLTSEGFHVRHINRGLLDCIANELTYSKEKSWLYELLCRDYDVVSVGKGVSEDEIKKYIENDLENISTDELCLIWEGFREKDIPKTIEEAFKGLSRAQKAVVEYLFQPTEFDDEESSFILAFLVAYGRCSPTQYAIALIGPAESEDGVIECGEEFMLAKERANSCYEYMQLSAKGLDILDY